MKYYFEVTALVEYETVPGSTQSKIISSSMRLDTSKNIDRNQYVKRELPTADGCKVTGLVLATALTSIIHYAHDMKYRDSAEHLRAIIRHLEDGFIQQSKPVIVTDFESVRNEIEKPD